MKTLINKLFKRSEPVQSYVIAEYKPGEKKPFRNRIKIGEYEIDLVNDHDEMEIDNIYQNS